MRIISKFHDYYDCMQRYGQDDGLVYMRNKETHYFSEHKHLQRQICHKFLNLHYYKFHIGFAGKIYSGLEFCSMGERMYCYSVADVDKIVNFGETSKKEKATYFDSVKPKGRFWRGMNRWCNETQYNIREVFEELKEKAEQLPNYFEKYNTPIFYADSAKLISNPCLKDMDFQRVINTQVAYQELQMYLSNQASPEKPIPQVTDKDMRDIKGFDQYSFKKEKSKK